MSEGQRVESLPDPAREAPDPVLTAFVDGFVAEEPEFDERLQERAREVLAQRPLAPDALGAALALDAAASWIERHREAELARARRELAEARSPDEPSQRSSPVVATSSGQALPRSPSRSYGTTGATAS